MKTKNKINVKTAKAALDEKREEALKYEFLKLSPRYKALCEMVRSAKLKPPYDARKIAALFPAGRGYTSDSLNEFRVPIKIINTFIEYGDIHQPDRDFEAYWKEKQAVREAYKGRPVVELVTDYIDSLPMYSDLAKQAQKLLKIKDLEKSLIFVHRAFLGRTILVIDRLKYSQREENTILSKIKQIIHKSTRDANFHEDTNKKYLVAYRLHELEGLPTSRVFAATRESESGQSYSNKKDKESKIRKDVRKAKKIMKNIENGISCWWNV